ncbi:hypothetical protein Tco_0200238 [Tanacetum coccineum]
MATLSESTPQVKVQAKEPPLSTVNTLRSGEASMEPDFELTNTVPPTPHDSPLLGGYTLEVVLDLETDKDAQALEILRLKKRVKRLERQIKSRRRLYKLVFTASAPVTTAGVTISTAEPTISVVEPSTPPTTTSLFDDEDLTMAQTLMKLKKEKAKEKGVSFKDTEELVRPARLVLTLKPLPSIDPKEVD